MLASVKMGCVISADLKYAIDCHSTFILSPFIPHPSFQSFRNSAAQLAGLPVIDSGTTLTAFRTNSNI